MIHRKPEKTLSVEAEPDPGGRPASGVGGTAAQRGARCRNHNFVQSRSRRNQIAPYTFHWRVLLRQNQIFGRAGSPLPAERFLGAQMAARGPAFNAGRDGPYPSHAPMRVWV